MQNYQGGRISKIQSKVRYDGEKEKGLKIDSWISGLDNQMHGGAIFETGNIRERSS